MDSIQLRKMSSIEYSSYLLVAIPNYANEKMKGEGLTQEQANIIARDSFESLLPEGLETKNQFFFSVSLGDHVDSLGTVWIGIKGEGNQAGAFIYDLILDSRIRGKGFGKQLMKLIEAEVLKLQLKSISLHVFGHNIVATNLYKKSGFRTANRIMKKELF